MSEAIVKKSDQEDKQLQYIGGISTGTGIGAYEPTDLKAAMDLCQILCAGGLVPRDLQNKPGDVLTLIATGRDYGLSWPAALQNLYVVHGRIGSYAEFQRSRIMQHPTCELFELVEATGERATIRVKKPTMDEAVDVSFSVEDAIQARLMKRLASGEAVAEKGPDSNWSKYTSDMLVARATTRAKRRYFPYVLTDLSSVEELHDLPVEKNVTPVSEKAGAAAAAITAAAGRKVEPKGVEEPPPPPAATEQEKAAQTLAHFGDEGEPKPPAPPPAEGDTQKIPDTMRRDLLKTVDGVGPKVLASLEEHGAVTARHILKLETSGLKELPGIGELTAEALIAWASKKIDETHRAEALVEKDEAAAAPPADEEPESARWPKHYRDASYVRGLMKLAEERGVTKAQLRARLDELAHRVGLPADVDPRALPDAQWVALQDWVQSGTEESLPLAGEDAPKPEAPPTISEAKVRIIQNMLENLLPKMGTAEAEAWQANLAAWLREKAGVESYRDLPAEKYQPLLSYVSETTDHVR